LIASHTRRRFPMVGKYDDYQAAKYCFDRTFAVSLNPDENDNTDNTRCCFTDGSRIEGIGSGAGVFFPEERLKHAIPLGKHTSVFQAEIFAILDCSRCPELLADDRSVLIRTDSQAAIKALAAVKINSKLVQECRNALDNLGSTRQLTIQWVKAHAGTDGNEEADKLARRGANSAYIGPEPALCAGKSFYRVALEKWVDHASEQVFTQSPGAAQSKQMLGRPDKGRSKHVLKWSRNDLRKYTEIVTGHAPLNRHLSLMRLVEDPLCHSCGEEEETAMHLVARCEAYQDDRRRILGANTLTAQAVLRVRPQSLLKFIKATGRL
jgi:ribonuclease HI